MKFSIFSKQKKAFLIIYILPARNVLFHPLLFIVYDGVILSRSLDLTLRLKVELIFQAYKFGNNIILKQRMIIIALSISLDSNIRLEKARSEEGESDNQK